jgi:hypothetical protein
MDTNTAATEPSTLAPPLTAQAQGAMAGASSEMTRMPLGRRMPIRKPGTSTSSAATAMRAESGSPSRRWKTAVRPAA